MMPIGGNTLNSQTISFVVHAIATVAMISGCKGVVVMSLELVRTAPLVSITMGSQLQTQTVAFPALRVLVTLEWLVAVGIARVHAKSAQRTNAPWMVSVFPTLLVAVLRAKIQLSVVRVRTAPPGPIKTPLVSNHALLASQVRIQKKGHRYARPALRGQRRQMALRLVLHAPMLKT